MAKNGRRKETKIGPKKVQKEDVFELKDFIFKAEMAKNRQKN